MTPLPTPIAMVDTSTGPAASGDHYYRTLWVLAEDQNAFVAALTEAQGLEPDARHKALVTLHRRLRAMAATANRALGQWPDVGGEAR